MSKLVSLNARKQKVLGFAALILTIIFLLSTTGNISSDSSIENESVLSSSSGIPTFKDSNQLDTSKLSNANDLVKDKSGKIDESKVKQAEEIAHIRAPAKPLIGEAGAPKKASNLEDIKKVLSNEDEEDEGLANTKSEKGVEKEVNTNTKNTLNPPPKIKADKALVKEDSTTNTNNKKLSEKSVSDKKADLTIKKGASSDIKDPVDGFDSDKELQQILAMSPIIVFSKSYCPYSKKLKDLLKTSYEIIPEPVIVELDLHEHGKELQESLSERTGRKTVPNLMIKGVSRGGSDEMAALHRDNELLENLQTWAGSAAKIEKVNIPSNS